MTVYSLDVLLSQFGTTPLFHVQFCCVLTCIQISREAGKVVWYSHLLKNFPQFIVTHTVKDFSRDHEAEVDVFLELSCFFYGPPDDGNLISGSSVFSKSVPLPDSQAGESIVGLELLQQCENVFDIIVVQFVGHLLGGSVDLCHTLSLPGLLRPQPLSQWQTAADPCLHRKHSNTQRQVWLSLCGVSGSRYTQGFVWALRASLADMGFWF